MREKLNSLSLSNINLLKNVKNSIKFENTIKKPRFDGMGGKTLQFTIDKIIFLKKN